MYTRKLMIHPVVSLLAFFACVCELGLINEEQWEQFFEYAM